MLKTENLNKTGQKDGNKPSFNEVTQFLNNIFNENVIKTDSEKETVEIHTFFKTDNDKLVDLETKTEIVLNCLKNNFGIIIPLENTSFTITCEDEMWDTIDLKNLLS